MGCPRSGLWRALPALALIVSAQLAPSALGAQTAGSAALGAADRGPESIRPGDKVRLSVSRHEDLTGEFAVNEYGRVTIPKLGEIDVSAETYRSLRERIIRELQATVVSPAIDVVVLKRVRVLGEVNEPGLYYPDPTMTVADALAMAGGPTSEAKRGTAILRRGGETIVADMRIETLISDSPIRSGDELEVPQRSWFSRNGVAVISSATGLLGVMLALVWR